ncbi:MAG: hypothetical protein LUF34_09210 [Lachnospiraceae bacterium]|nr:hypothetical protein [Lachnospiraceae bacterium]
MSDYNFYAKHLDEAFRKARTAYTDAFNRAEKTRKDYEAALRWRKESRDGENEERRRSPYLE